MSDSLERLFGRASSPALLAAGALVLVGMHVARAALRDRAVVRAAELSGLEETLEESSQALSESVSLRDMKAKDLERFKNGLSRLTESRRAMYEGGMQLQEETRLLEKQWEIMTTYLMIDEEAGKIHVMRGEQSLETFPVSFAPPKAFGGEARPPSFPTPIISKERFAHPERGKSEMTPDGQLQWEPPQVGTSVRSNALGEFVVFSKGPLILHGPPRNPAEHDRFPHLCLGLTLPVARKLYALSFMGTKIAYKAPVPRIFAKWGKRP